MSSSSLRILLPAIFATSALVALIGVGGMGATFGLDGNPREIAHVTAISIGPFMETLNAHLPLVNPYMSDASSSANVDAAFQAKLQKHLVAPVVAMCAIQTESELGKKTRATARGQLLSRIRSILAPSTPIIMEETASGDYAFRLLDHILVKMNNDPQFPRNEHDMIREISAFNKKFLPS